MATVTRGQMRMLIRLEKPVKTADDAGGHTGEFVGWVNLRGYFKKRSGFRTFEEALDALVQEYEAWIPWRKEFENMSKDIRFVYDNRIFKILSYERVNEQKHLMKFTLIEAS